MKEPRKNEKHDPRHDVMSSALALMSAMPEVDTHAEQQDQYARALLGALAVYERGPKGVEEMLEHVPEFAFEITKAAR